MGVKVLPAPCPTDALAEGGRFWLVLGLGEFKPTLLKGCPDQHPPRCPGKVLRERRGSPETAASSTNGPASARYRIGPAVPKESLLPQTGTWGEFEYQGGMSAFAPQQPGVSHLSSSHRLRFARTPSKDRAAAELAATDTSSVLSRDALVNEGAAICLVRL